MTTGRINQVSRLLNDFTLRTGNAAQRQRRRDPQENVQNLRFYFFSPLQAAASGARATSQRTTLPSVEVYSIGKRVSLHMEREAQRGTSLKEWTD